MCIDIVCDPGEFVLGQEIMFDDLHTGRESR